MSIKHYLGQLWRLDQLIEAKLESLEVIRSLAEKTTYTPSEILIQKTSKEGYEKLIIKMVTLQEEINKHIDKLIDLKRKIILQIDKVDDHDCKLLLILRYVNFKRWEEIAVEMGYSFQWVCGGLHSKALQKFAKIYKE